MAKFENGWLPYEGGNILSDSEEVKKQKLHVQMINGREIVFAGDEKAVAFLQENGFSPVSNLDTQNRKDFE